MSGHTPGPWVPSGQLILGPLIHYPDIKPDSRWLIVGEVHWNWNGEKGGKESRIRWKEAEANQRLMCAAPDLYCSLKELLEICRSKCSPLDEQLLPNKTNHEALLDACNVLDRIREA